MLLNKFTSITTPMNLRHAIVCALFMCIASSGLRGDGRNAFWRPPAGWVRTACVHDPSIFKDRDGKYYIFGTHLASAESANLISWKQTATFRSAIDTTTADRIRAYNDDASSREWFGYLWAPDIVYNKKMRKYCVYLSANGDHWQSNIVLLTADKLHGPYEYAGTVVYGGFTPENWDKTDVSRVLRTSTLPERYITYGVKNGKWGFMFPNCIDPCVFYDSEGHLLMTYGSWSGGIFMLALDEKTGLRDEKIRYPVNIHSDAYFGKKIAGGQYASGEGSYIQKIGDWYWLFMSYGKLDAKGGYNVRVFRARRPGGPYYDRLGNTPFYDRPKDNFNDSIGVRLFGAYRWNEGEEGMVAQGHNSAMVDDDGRAYIVYHTRTTAGHEGHYIRIHQLFLNKEGWLVAAPYRFRGERLDKKGLAKNVVAGDYDIILHRREIDYAHLDCASPERITLKPDRTISGAKTGKWELERNSPYITISFDGGDTYRGVAFIQAVDGTNNKTPVFTALGDDTQLTLWGAKVK